MNQMLQTCVEDPKVLDVKDIDYIEIYTGNAKQSAFYYSKMYGFQITGYSGLETGNREFSSYFLEQADARLIVTSPYSAEHSIAEFINKRGDGVRDIALLVDDVDKAYNDALQNGAIGMTEPYEQNDERGIIKKAVLKTFGETIHTLVERKNYEGVLLPGYKSINHKVANNNGIVRFDHLAICVENMQEWISYYEKVLGFSMVKQFHKDEISSKASALMTKVLQNGTERIKLAVIEPAEGKKKSQIQEFIEYNKGAGVQHIAVLTEDILKTVETLQNNGAEFLYTPDTYYEMLPSRVGEIDESIEMLRKLKVLVDRDEEGYLLQIFAQPIQDRPTLFFEVIQRKGSRGFGNGNIKALFESVEREQALRGNL
ncbi:4-hydroxyphenylpyruvate dioxygenase [Paenibacillus sp. E194]|uniref:4-hydroxyphenylpyruvate dioxygenase n=1 Tax=Paenibacillus sp. E194 TaxID=1458845 RepID=UPI000A490E76|nr:4-hydroxyphenylpyruvate dioxygenase [Paenibacillus sp. E194]